MSTQARRPNLPAKMPNGSPWPAQTKAWYTKWEGLTPLQYDELMIAAVLHGQMWNGTGNAATASELRKRVDALTAARQQAPAAAPVKRPARPWLKDVLGE